MLRGQSSLSRLVGKCRRPETSSSVGAGPSDCLGGAHSLPKIQGAVEFPGLSKKKNGFGALTPKPIGDNGDLEKENLPLNWVQCPVCLKDIQGDNSYINVHVDFCLLEKANSNSTKPGVAIKRKRLSLTYAKQELSKLTSDKSTEVTVYVADIVSSELVENEKSGGQAAFAERLVAIRENSDLPMYHDCNCACHEKDILKRTHIAAEIESSKIEDKKNAVHVLETFIVGRKFNRHAKIEKDMEIQVLREPENPKDGNAIKIVGPNSQGNLTLGHLPRDLASLLACPLDKEQLQIKGNVIRVPEKAFEPVPIALFCEKTLGKEIENLELFDETWQRILDVGKAVIQREEALKQQPSKHVKNFTYLLKAVLQQDSHLFNARELEFLGSFFSLTEDAQCLFVRLSQRKGPWFRVSQINYTEISDVEQASCQLVAAGFFSFGDGIEKGERFEKAFRERLHLLSVPELKQIMSMVNFKHKRQGSSVPKKDELLDWIMFAAKEKHQDLGTETGSEEAAIVPLVFEAIGLSVCVSDMASFLLWRLQRLFFLNGEQDTSSFLLVDMGAIKYPSYVCSQTRRAFVTREALLAYEQALEVAQTMDAAVEGNDLNSIEHCLNRASLQLTSKQADEARTETCGLQDPFLARFSATWVFATIVTVGVSVLERERRYAEAVCHLEQLLNQPCCPGRRGYWTVRLSMDLEHLGYKEESLQVAEDGLNDSRIRHGGRIALQRRVVRLGKPPRRWKKPSFARALSQSCKEVIINGRPLNRQTGSKSRFYGYNNDQCSVEELALQHYAGDSGGGWQGVHCEGGIWMTLFALLMWDVLFVDIPNVFWHPFQAAPLDLDTDAFYLAREPLIEAQLQRIQTEEVPQLLATTWSKWFGTVCRGLNWERYKLQELQTMAACVGGRGLASVCRLLAEDHAGLAGGMPDLFLWRVPNSRVACALCSDGCPNAYSSFAGEAKLVEVKGPRDQLSDQQRAWISTLMEAGIDVEVCKVREQVGK
ncbi:hypothetical protein GOP47_0016649 [Adiantum capillus-veneris]|uniref:Fanconi-associated nuclease n=1 Tax=Adiantum capillus-veneris TaxID=13818 RepID=A0A9D4ZAX4_ADICA|nr:hypothetical protein GOP47_0016649 [Adiantum capillus-veneris]